VEYKNLAKLFIARHITRGH